MDIQEFWDDYQYLKKEVNKLRSSEERLKNVRARYASLFNASPQLIIILDRNGQVVDMNPAAITLFGLKQNNLGRTVPETFQNEGLRTMSPVAQECIRKGEVQRFELKFDDANGHLHAFAATVAPVLDTAGTPEAALLSATDITDLRTAQEDLETLRNSINSLTARIGNSLQQRLDPKPVTLQIQREQTGTAFPADF